jgi:hypothetical protein
MATGLTKKSIQQIPFLCCAVDFNWDGFVMMRVTEAIARSGFSVPLNP